MESVAVGQSNHGVDSAAREAGARHAGRYVANEFI